MIAKEEFESLYQDLASAWETHQALRLSRPPIELLADSSERLNQARIAMWDWHRCHNLTVC